MPPKHAAPPKRQYTISPATPAQAQATAAQKPQVLQVVSNAGTPQEHRINLPPFSELGKNPQSYGAQFLRSSGAIPLMWGIALGLVAVDEWRTNHILARPARLWWTTIAFAILALAAHFEKLAMIANLLAVGFVLQLAYQFFTKSGEFIASGETFNAQGQQTA